MSEGETKGRCRSEMTAAYGARGFKPNDSDLVTADALDRLAADVAAIKAKVDAISPEDVAHLVECEKAWVRLVEEKETAAIRKRDEARAEVEKLKESRDAANRLYGATLAEVERLRAIVHSDAGHMAKILIENERLRAGPAAPQPAAVSDAQPAAWGLLRVGGRFVDSFVSKTQAAKKRLEWNANENWEHAIVPLYAAPAAGWLTEEERELLALLKHTADGCSMVHSPWRRNWPYARMSLVVNAILARAGSPPEQTAAGWLTAEERELLQTRVHALRAYLRKWQADRGSVTREVEIIDALLARAGSPPVVALPTVFARSLLGDELVALQQVKDSLDKAGVAWKEV